MKACTAAVALLLLASPAQAAADDAQVLARLRECGRIADVPARVACYDRQLGIDMPPPPDGAASARPPVIPAPFPAQSPAARPKAERITAHVTAMAERAPGIWQVTLEDGTQWQFVDAAPAAFDPPRAGAQVDIAPAALGSHILRYRGQAGLRIRRIR